MHTTTCWLALPTHRAEGTFEEMNRTSVEDDPQLRSSIIAFKANAGCCRRASTELPTRGKDATVQQVLAQKFHLARVLATPQNRSTTQSIIYRLYHGTTQM